MKNSASKNQFYMPAEWQQHDACWMAWPCRANLWPNLEAAFDVYAQIANAIVEYEPVRMLVGEQQMKSAQLRLDARIELYVSQLDDSWSRDSGPTFVINRKSKNSDLVAVDWRFNGWGQKFIPYEQDAQMASRIASIVGCKILNSKLTIEGGAFHVNGTGSLITTKQCAMHRNRNADWGKKQIEDEFARCLGVNNIIWLESGLVDDHTDGHIDELACFASEDRIVALGCEDREDANYEILNNNFEMLSQSVNSVGKNFEIQSIHQPEARYLADGSRMSLSYINYYHANNAIIMAAFGQSDYDSNAFEIMKKVYPEREIIQINALSLFEGGGGIHCITQQQPRVHLESDHELV